MHRDDEWTMVGLFFEILCKGNCFVVVRFGGKQIHASEDDGQVNHALVRDLDAESQRLE